MNNYPRQWIYPLYASFSELSSSLLPSSICNLYYCWFFYISCFHMQVWKRCPFVHFETMNALKRLIVREKIECFNADIDLMACLLFFMYVFIYCFIYCKLCIFLKFCIFVKSAFNIKMTVMGAWMKTLANIWRYTFVHQNLLIDNVTSYIVFFAFTAR